MPQTFREVFPRFSRILSPQIQDRIFDIKDNTCYEVLIIAFNELLSKGNVKRIAEICTDFKKDVEELEADGIKTGETHYLRFYSACVMLGRLRRLERYDQMGEWLWVDDTLDEVSDIVYPSLFWNVDNKIVERSRNVVAWVWISTLFYYSVVTGQFVELCKQTMDQFGGFLYNIYSSENAFANEALGPMFTWNIIHKRTADALLIAQLLEALYINPAMDNITRIASAFWLSVREVERIGIDGKIWAQRVLNDYPHELGDMKPQLIMNACIRDVVLLQEKLPELLKALKDRRISILQNEHIGMQFIGARNFAVLHNTLDDCMRALNTDLAEEIFFENFGIPSYSIMRGKIIHVVPNAEDGVNYYLNNKVVNNPIDSLVKAVELIRVESMFLGIPISIIDVFDYEEVEVPAGRIGVPVPGKSNQYLTELTNYYNFKKLLELDIDNAYGLYDYYGYRRSIQTAILIEIGMVLPIIQSFQPPLSVRPVKRVFIWRGKSLLPDDEVDGVKKIMEKRNVAVTILEGDKSTVADFKRHYSDSVYDAVILCGHGEYSWFDPDNSYIQLHEGKELSLQEISELKINDVNRRLLFLNICDGASSILKNGPEGISLSQSLVSPQQSVFSHLWPIDAKLSMFLNWIIAALMLENSNYSDIYSKMVMIIKSGKEEMINFLSQYIEDNDMLDRIRNTDYDFSLYYYWGSITYAI